MVLFGILLMLSINKNNKADAKRAWKTNSTSSMTHIYKELHSALIDFGFYLDHSGLIIC